jgi:hypothetical protein
MTKPETHTLQALDTNANGKKKNGRPSTYNPQTAQIICDRIAGGETMVNISKTPGIPTPQTVHQWRRKYPEFAKDYATARADQMETWADEIVSISDDSALDTMDGPKGGQVSNNANVQRDRLRVDTRKFLMAKINPLFADKVAHDHSGTIEQTVVVQLSDRERMRRLASFMLQDQSAGLIIDGEASPSGGNGSHLAAANIIKGAPAKDG